MASTTLLDPVEEAIAALRDPGAVAEVATAFCALTPHADDVPLPGSGRTWERFAFLARVAAASPALARLVEGHLDARAILAELGTPSPPGALLGVWAAEPGLIVTAERAGTGWRLDGVKPYASGANELTHALITARDGDDRLLFLVPADGWQTRSGTWHAVGMAGSDSPTVDVAATVGQDALAGPPGSYLARPGFWHGGVGVAAVWHGGAVGVAAELHRAAAARSLEPHAAAHLGGVEVALAASTSMLREAARAIDDDPLDLTGEAQRRARTVRAAVERSATETLDRVGRALGAGPLCHDRAHARRVADLTVYLRQSHAESDLEALGRMVAGE
jgi:alkylation response protein AidB-like acyl-CoA dehydrogenase